MIFVNRNKLRQRKHLSPHKRKGETLRGFFVARLCIDMLSTARLLTQGLHNVRVPSRFFSNWRTAFREPRSSNALISTLAVIAATGTSLYMLGRNFNLHKLHCVEDKEIQTKGLKKFEGKTVLITGAAGDLGSTTARAFSEQGARIILCDLASTEAKLKQLTTELLSLGSPSVIYASVDVTNVEDVKKCVHLAVKEFGGIDILFNNAGILGQINLLQETDEVMFKKIQDVNVYGVFVMMKYVSNKMIESGRGGVIVNVSSVVGLKGSRYIFPYVASKFAVSGMTRAAARSLARYNIRVNALSPGFLEGNMKDELFEAIVQKGLCKNN